MKGYHDIAGDGGSNVVGQVEARAARIAASLAGVRAKLAIGSGKGGVGKSTLTMALAHVLRARGREVAILDADLNGPCQARLGGIGIRPPVPGERGLLLPRTASGVGVVSMGTLTPENEALDFDSVAAGDAHVWRATRELTALADLLAGVEWGTLDVLLVDLPPGAERLTQYADFFGPDTVFVLVTIPSDVSRGVVARSLAALRTKPNRILGYVSNMDGYLCPGCGERKPLFPESDAVTLDAPCLARVPFDPRLAGAIDVGATTEPADAIADLAGRIEREILVAERATA